MKYILAGIDCAACASQIEEEIRKIDGLSSVLVDPADFSLILDAGHVQTVQAVVARLKPGVRLIQAKQEGPVGIIPRRWLTVLAAAVIFVAAYLAKWILPHAVTLADIAFLFAYLVAGTPVILSAFNNIARGRVFDENFLMTLATFGAIALQQLPEAAAVMLFYRTGEFLQGLAMGRSKRAIAALLDLRPPFARLLNGGETKKVAPDAVEPGQMIEIRPGERVPLDGDVLAGNSFVNPAALTGESAPRAVGPLTTVAAGEVNESGLLRVIVSRPYRESAVARIVDLVEGAVARKAPSEQFISRFARWYTPTVVGCAVVVAFFPPLFIPEQSLAVWAYRALVLLVISCPCALVLSVPLSYFAGLGQASRSGILVRGGDVLDTLSAVDTFVFDKTGTLTMGEFALLDITPQDGFSKEELLRWACLAEAHSSHPVARALQKQPGCLKAGKDVTDCTETGGYGVLINIDGRRVMAGSSALMRREGITLPGIGPAAQGTTVYVAVDDQLVGQLTFGDSVKGDAAATVAALKQNGIQKTFLLTGDSPGPAAMVTKLTGLDGYAAELTPADKADRVKEMRKALRERRSKGRVVFVGDGINDAPALATADVGVAMGARGTDLAIETADVVIMNDELSLLAGVVALARRTKMVVTGNIALSLGVKLFFAVLSIAGMATMWEAVFADVGVTILAVTHAASLLGYQRFATGRPGRETGNLPASKT